MMAKEASNKTASMEGIHVQPRILSMDHLPGKHPKIQNENPAHVSISLSH